MDNELLELEAELKRLRPVAPSPFVQAKVQQALGRSRRAFLAWTALPLAAAFAIMSFFKNDTPPAPAAKPLPPAPAQVAATYKPVSAKNVLYDRRDDGIVTLADGTAARRYRASYVDTITWKNPHTQASLRWSVPRTEERVVPVSFQ